MTHTTFITCGNASIFDAILVELCDFTISLNVYPRQKLITVVSEFDAKEIEDILASRRYNMSNLNFSSLD